MFSRRTAWSRAPNPLAQRLERLQALGQPLVDLTESNPLHAQLEYPSERILAALAAPQAVSYDPDPRGLLSARRAVCRHLAEAGASIEPEDVLLTASTSEAYAYLFKLLCDPRDNVLVFDPSYPLFDFLTRLEAVELRRGALVPASGWGLDVEGLGALGDERTRAVIVVNPGNPTGQFLKAHEWAALDALCVERDWALISDEVFADYALTPDEPERVRCAAARAGRALTFSLSGLSKVAGLPQLKLGWICAGGPEDVRREALQRLELIADTYLSVNTPVQVALEELLEAGVLVRRQIIERVAANRRLLRERQRAGAPWSLLPAEAGWSAVLRVPVQPPEEELCLQLLEAGVSVQPGYFFDFASPGYVVLSCLPPSAVFAEGVERIARVLQAAMNVR